MLFCSIPRAHCSKQPHWPQAKHRPPELHRALPCPPCLLPPHAPIPSRKCLAPRLTAAPTTHPWEFLPLYQHIQSRAFPVLMLLLSLEHLSQAAVLRPSIFLHCMAGEGKETLGLPDPNSLPGTIGCSNFIFQMGRWIAVAPLFGGFFVRVQV